MSKIAANFYSHFNKNKSTSLGNLFLHEFTHKIFRDLKPEQPEHHFKILEIGPGKGDFAKLCLEKKLEYWAVEPNIEMADALEKYGAKVIKSLVPPIPSLPVKFDAIVMIHMLEHLDSMSAALEVAKNAFDLLEDKGTLLICSPDFLNFGKHFFLVDFSHNYVTSYRRITQLLESAGFNEIRGYYMSGPFKGLLCFIASFAASIMPFAWLAQIFPKNKIIHKLYKGQVTFLRNVVIIGQK